MRRTVFAFWAATLAALVLLAIGGTSILGGSDPVFPWSIFASSGNSSSSLNHQLGSTTGQSSIGVSSGDSGGLCAGFWCGAALVTPTPTPTPTVTPTATDTPTATATSTPTSPIPPKFDALLLKIEGLPGPPGLRTSLSAKLNTAQRLAERANPCASANVLGAFINQVEAQTGIMISASDASLLLAQAKSIIDELLDGVTCPPDPDTDGDLMTDSAEITLGTNPSNPDTDTDIPSDGMELLHTGTDPLDPDTDGDGTPDGGEDPDMDGCTTGAEVQTAPGSETTGGLRDPLNEWDFYDVDGDGSIDVVFDILPVILAYQQGPNDPGGPGPNYTAAKDRGPPVAGAVYPWHRTGPDGSIDVPNDLLPIIFQYLHSCK